MNNDQKNMFLAIALSAVVLFTWQYFFAPPVVPTTETSQGKIESTSTKTNEPQVSTQTETPTPAPIVNREVETLELNNDHYAINLSNDLTLSSMKSKGAVFEFEDIAGSKSPLKIQALTAAGVKDVVFSITDRNATSFKGVDANLGITIIAQLSSESGRFSFSLSSTTPYKYRFTFNSVPEQLDNNQIREFIYFGKEVERFSVGDEHKSDATLNWFGLDFNYHLISVVLDQKMLSTVTAFESGKVIVEGLKENNIFQADLIFAKKNYDQLVAMGDKLDLSVDFGIFGILAVPILRGLQFFYDFIPNYGIAIILLTLVIRLITFPLQYKSFKSMKKMQKVQPQLQKLKEKYKDDPQRMQRETMELFKKAGANPLGGCLPMILQMPVFFAFYQVLYNAVELVQAPFAFWIVDLSVKDPYYALPVLMGLSFFFQSKLNPSTSADPTQQKIMMFMPLIFCFIMKDLPAGLNLYIFVSTLFGIVQQLLVYKTTD